MKSLESIEKKPGSLPSMNLADSLRVPRGEQVAAYRTRNISRKVDADGICTLTFDRPNSSANVFDRETLMELDSHLEWIEHASELRGLILASAKGSIFVAGADIHSLAAMADAPATAGKDNVSSALKEIIRLGQGVFNRLAALNMPRIAAIHGACVGGGYELALTCDYRVATDARATKIGLPEINLGILPAWGGCTRLPRLIGIPGALEIILAGKVVASARAMKMGMIDDVVPRENLLEVAKARILKPIKLDRSSHRVSNNAISAMLIGARVNRELATKTRGNYPAPFEALDVVTHGISLPMEKSLELEREAILRLADTQACRNLLRLFLLKEKAKKSSPDVHLVTRAAVIGAGVMGAGIAQWLSSRGVSVILRDVSLDQLVRGMATVTSLYEDAVKRHRMSAIEARDGKDRIFAASTDVPMRDVEIIVEAATEKLPLKQDIFRCLAAQASSQTILATNTSAISITEIAAATPCPERVVGLHFFNPVHRMELVEIVAGAKTSSDVLVRTAELARRIGKLPVIVKDSPGFIVNRVLMPYLVEAVRLFDVGASAHDIDEVMLDFGMPMGPLRLLDEVGVDVAAHVVSTLAGKFGERVAAPALIEKMMAANLLGKKSGQGFYDHSHKKANHDLDAMRSVHRHARFTHDELAQRMSLLMVNEAARCVEEHITAGPDVIDLAMVLGTGFAPFRGGPLRYADSLGVANVVAILERFAATEPRFTPCALLKEMAANSSLFYPAKGGAK